MRIFTPVFLEFAITRAFPEREQIIEEPQVILIIIGLIGYILIWLWLQRTFVYHLELIKPFDILTFIFYGAFPFVGLAYVYYGWFVPSLLAPIATLIMAILFFDLVAHIIMLLLRWRLRGTGPGIAASGIGTPAG